MSTFSGRIPELPGVMIDRLEPDPDVQAFFISHDHADHTRGIRDPKLHDLLRASTGISCFGEKSGPLIFVSPLTARMMYNRDELYAVHNSIQPLELDVPHTLKICFACNRPHSSFNDSQSTEGSASGESSHMSTLGSLKAKLHSDTRITPINDSPNEFCSESGLEDLSVESAYCRAKKSTLDNVISSGPCSLPLVSRSSSDYNNAYTLKVTLIAAGHIMGSVMFLFEKEMSRDSDVCNFHTESFRCLYTGDFRLSMDEIKRNACFYNLDHCGRKLKLFNAVYFDSTWCSADNHWTIPLREDVLRELKPLLQGFLEADKENIVCLYTTYNVGYENLLKFLAKISSSPVHVSSERLTLYRGFSGLEEVLSSDVRSRVHFCQRGFPPPYQGCEIVRCRFKTRAMKLFASYKSFIKEHKKNIEMNYIIEGPRGQNFYKVCWSTHPSLQEVSNLLNFLDPERAYPNVVNEKNPSCTENAILEELARPFRSRARRWHPPVTASICSPGSSQQSEIEEVSPSKRKKKLEDVRIFEALTPLGGEDTDDSSNEGLMERLQKKGLSKGCDASQQVNLDSLQRYR